jgi:HTH-type transcriptional regulator/antitoxin HipB
MSPNGDYAILSSIGDIRGEDAMRLRTAADFGAVIRNRRLRAGLNQAALARKVGVGRQWIVEVEKGKAGAPLALILRTLKALNIGLETQEGGGQIDRPTRMGSKKGKEVSLDALLDNLRRKKS